MSDHGSIPISSLWGGISKQPAHMRFPNQVEEADNALLSVTDGASKRPGSNLSWLVSDSSSPSLTADEDYRIYVFNRDDDEEYIIVYGYVSGSIVIKAYRVGSSTAQTVNIDSDAETYLEAGSPSASDLRLVSIGDYIVFVNTKATPAVEASADYTVTGVHRDWETMVSSTPTDGTYHRAVEDITNFPAGYWQYDVSGTYATIQFAELTGGSLAWAGEVGREDANNSDYLDSDNNPGDFDIGFLEHSFPTTAATFTNATKRLSQTGVFLNYAFEEGDQYYVTGGTGVTAGWYDIAAKIDQDTIELVDDIGGTNPTDVTGDGVGREYGVTVDFRNETVRDMHDIALGFQNAMRDAGADDACCSWTSTGVLSGYFTITSPYKGSGTKCYAPTTATNSNYDWTDTGRPFASSGSSTTNGTGSTSNRQTPGERWYSVAAPDQAGAQIDVDTAPVQMVRTTLGSPSTFTVSTIDWNTRKTGGNSSNPAPEVFAEGIPIRDVGILRNRLVLAGGQYVHFSQADDLFNFYVADAGNLVDSDPVTLNIPGDEVSVAEYIVPFQKNLAVFTQAGEQFEIDSDGVFTPETARIRPTTKYNTVGVKPVVLDSFLVFGTTSSKGSHFHEYSVYDANVTEPAPRVTMHVDGLLPATVHSLAASNNHGMLFVLGEDESDLFVYREYRNGRQLEQAAWSKWDFDDNYRICDIGVLEDDLYMLVESSGEYVLEYIPLELPTAPSGFPNPIRLDRMVEVTGVYSDPNTTFTIPLKGDGSTINMFVLGNDFSTIGDPGDEVPFDDDTWTYSDPAKTIIVEGDYSEGSVMMGRFFNFKIEPSRPYWRDEGGRANIARDVQVKCVIVNHSSDTQSYNIKTVQSLRSDRTKAYDSTALDPSKTEALFGGWSHAVTWTIENQTSLPCTLTAVEFVAESAVRG